MSEELKTIIVLGGSGLVGEGIKYTLSKEDESIKSLETWHFLSSKDGDLRDLMQCHEIFKKFKPTHVIHLAARVGGLFANMQKPEEFLSDNLRMNSNVLQLCHEYKVKKLVSCLSTCIFPDKVTYPIDETMIHLGPPHDSNYGYAYAKRLLDIQNKAYHQQYGCQFTSVIPTNIYGPHDNFSLTESHVIPGLIHKAHLAKLKGEPLVIGGSGSPLRQFIYSRDLGKLFIWVLREYNEIDPIILSVGEEDEISIRHVGETIAKAMKVEQGIKMDPSMADGQYKKTASNKKLRSYIKDFEFTSFEIGIKETVEWFNENLDKFRK